MSAQDSCLSLIKYFLFVFNLFFFVSCLMAPQPPAPAPATAAPPFLSPLSHHRILISSPQVLGSLIFCFGIWILVDKTSFVSFVGEGAWAVGEGLPGAGMDPDSWQVASWGLPCPRELHSAQLPRQVPSSAVSLTTAVSL